MKRIISFALCVIAAAVAFSSCEKGPTPDGAVGITSISITKALNSAIAADINGTIDEGAKTVTFIVPEGTSLSSVIPTVAATANDAVKIGSTVVESGKTTVSITDGTKIEVNDEVSVLSATYTVIVKDNDGVAELVSVAIEAASNEGLITKDVVAAEIADQMILRVPAAAFQKELTIKVVAGKNDVIKINDEACENGTAKVNTLFPIDIKVTDAVANVSKDYVVKVGKILGTQIKFVSSFALPDSKMDGSFSFDVNPVTGEPCFSFLATPTGGVKTLYVAKWNGSAFEVVGGAGVTNTTAAAAPILFKVNADGTPFVMFKSGDGVKNLISMKKFDGAAWSFVGAAGFSETFTTSFGEPDLAFDNGNPFFVYTGNDKNSAGYRNAILAAFNGSEWKNTPTPFNGLPVYGWNPEQASWGMFYTAQVATKGNVSYIVTSSNWSGYYVYKMENGALSNIIADFKPEGEQYGIPTSLDAVAGPDGNIYVLAASSAASQYNLYRIDEAAGKFVQIANTIQGSAGGLGSVAEGMAFGINPATGDIVGIFENADGIPTFSFINNNGVWEDFVPFAEDKYKNFPQIRFSPAGDGYAAFTDNTNKNVQLYKIEYEEDILPE